MTPEEEALIEAATSAFRQHGAEGVRSHPAWHDLGDDGRLAAFEATVRARRLEAARDPEGLSSTAHAILAKIQRR
jgi:hypothetical protein